MKILNWFISIIFVFVTIHDVVTEAIPHNNNNTTDSPTLTTMSDWVGNPTTTVSPTTTSSNTTIITGYAMVLYLGLPYGSSSNRSYVMETLKLSVSAITGSDLSNVRELALEIPQPETRRRLRTSSRKLEVQNLLNSYVLSFDVHYETYADSAASTALLRDSINTSSTTTPNYKADSQFSEKLVLESQPEYSCIRPTRSEVVWTKSMYVISNTTFFPLEQELGPEIGT